MHTHAGNLLLLGKKGDHICKVFYLNISIGKYQGKYTPYLDVGLPF